MKNSISEQSFYIESDEEDSEKELNGEGKEGETGSDSDTSFAEIRGQSKPGSYTTSWPQSYRQSIDLYSSVPSPSVNFLGGSSLSRLGSSFLSSSLTRRLTPEALPSTVKPLLEKVEDEHQPHHRRSSRSLLPPLRRKSSIRKDDRPFRVSHELPMSRQSSVKQAVLNGMNVLCGVGILSTPYAVKEGGWLGLFILLLFGVLSFYTGMLLRCCLDTEPGLETFPDIGQAAFGSAGRIVISIILYVELYASCVEYIILESDNLSTIFPNAHINIGGLELDSHHLFALLTTLAVIPTVWLRDLSVLSYISAGGVISTMVVVLSLFWVGLVDQVGVHSQGTLLNLGTLPVAIGLYGFCYSGHAVFPNIYSSMAQPSKFPAVLLTCFGICTLMYAGVAFMGYNMFGESIQSQYTLNLPQNLVASKIAVTYAITISPVAMSLEELLPSNHAKSHLYAICIRTVLVISTLVVSLAVPFFGLVLSLIGSLLTMLVTLILPCACFLSILRRKVTPFQVAFCIAIIAVGAVSSAVGTYSAVSRILQQLSN
ncbi:hypothetical protein K2173_004102 [Erythroxylum novogranatense]|uniref:Amino acid transporter transmembrane domain-containing protein n=1 Tax=Erythroxylum novogranatense TaxID=1862640 RepID=A0AAV8SXA8_9ROSI|nr:hypothetical protein K2173_004102 [Erythroxylum novogranatense]